MKVLFAVRTIAIAWGCLLAAAAAAQTPAAQPGTSQPGISDFVGPVEIKDFQYSPSGKYISAVIASPDKPHENEFAVFDGQTGKALHLIHSGKRAQIFEYFWVNDDRLVVALAIQQSMLDTPIRTGELFAINADGSHSVDLFGYRKGDGKATYANARVISTSPVEPNAILIATNAFTHSAGGTYTGISRLEAYTGQTRSLGTSPARNATLLADHTGQVRVASASDDHLHYSMWLRPNNEAKWTLVNDPSQSHVALVPVGFNRDNSKLYVRVSQNKLPDTIELMDTTTLKRTLIYKPQFASPGDMLPTADRQDYYAVVTHDGKAGLHFLDEDSQEARLTKALQVNFPGELAYFSSFTRDGQHAVVTVTSDRDPGDYYIFDLKSHNAAHLIAARPNIDPEKMRPMAPVVIKARDGLPLHGFITLPNGPKPYPLVVLPHGGPHGISDEWTFDGQVQLLASRGYAVLQVNYRGSGGYGSWFQAIGFHQWGLSMQDDVTDATRWAIDQGYASPQRICIFGISYGGYAALEGAVREPELYKCAIGYSGVYDMRVQADESDTSRSSAGAAFIKITQGDDRDDLLARSPLGGVSRIKANVLLLHGGEDPRVPIENFKELTRAMDKEGKHYEQIVMPHEGHGFYLPEHQLTAYQKILDFLDQNIGHGQGATVANTSP